MTATLDLFGVPVSDEHALARPVRRTAGRLWKGGYAAEPGSGPAGETCGTCQHRARVGGHEIFQKCLLIERAWTNGPGTDIKCKTAACRLWQGIPQP